MQWYNKISARGIIKLTILLFSFLIIPYIILCFYAHPVADDYNFTSASPFWNSQWKLFTEWNGRYSANFMAVANPMTFNSLFGYRLASLLILLFIPLSIFFILSVATGKSLSFFQKMVGSILLSAFILNLLPSLSEGIYWYAGSVSYTLGCIIALFYSGTVIMYYKRMFFVSGFVHICTCIILLFIAIGFNEVQMLLLLFAHFAIWMSIKKEERFRSFWFLMLLFCMLFSATVIFSPGNHFRETYFPDSHRPLSALLMTLLQMLRFFFMWVSYAPLLLGSIIFIPVSSKLNKRSALFQRLGKYRPLTMSSLLWIILFLSIFPAYWSTGILGQHRTLNTACFFFIPTWFLFLHSIYTRINWGGKITGVLHRPVQISLTILLAASLLFSGNSGTALMDFVTGKVSGFDKEMNDRYDKIIAAKKDGLKEISLSMLQNKPQSLFVLDIQPGCTHWINRIQANFFGLTKICVDSTQQVNAH